ncbi:MAG: carboxypeptidase regulatory-like domain-containing protein [Verrucomicrobiota bacterium]|nr:carboxypeptidase regulatory-like domain-containing protein [Verrucomicrobiota bacterium]
MGGGAFNQGFQSSKQGIFFMSRSQKKLLLLTVLPLSAVAFVAFGTQPKAAQKADRVNTIGSSAPGKPIFAQAVNFAETIAVRDLPDADPSAFTNPQEGREKNELNAAQVKIAKDLSGKTPSIDSALPGKEKSGGINLPGAPLITFDGLADTDNVPLIGGTVAPSDENLAVGPNDVVQTVNDGFRVWDKTGTPKIAPKLISKLFASLGGVCSNTDRGDPIVQHDRMADRWVISQFNFVSSTAAPYHECIAVSKTSDPTGAYYAYDFITPGNEFPDYPHLGTWPDGYYMTVNQFTNGASFNGVGVYAFDRQKMLVGNPTAGFIYFNLNLTAHPEGIYAMQPSDMDGFQTPPAGDPNVFAYVISDEFESPPYDVDALRLFNFHADFINANNSTFTERSESPLAVSPFDPRYPTANQGRRDIKQPAPAVNPTDSLDNIGYHLMYRLQYRSLGGNEYLIGSTTVNVSGVDPSASIANYQAGIRYFQLTKGSAAAPYTLYDNATFSPDAGNPATGLNRWLPSAAIDGQGNLAVSYSTSSTTVFPSISYAGRDFNTTGALGGEQTLFTGLASQMGSGNRWGDYQSLQVDPTDDCTFWTTNQYYATSSSFNWKTRIGSFKFSTCNAPAQGTVSGTITTCDTGAPIAGAIVQISNGFSGATLPDGTYSISLPPGNYTATIIDPAQGCTASGPFNVTVTNGGNMTLSQCLTGTPQFAYQSAAVSGGNGNSVLDSFECANLNVTLLNQGCLTGTNTTAVLSSSTPGVTVTQPNSAYPNTAEGATATNSTPFTVSTSNAFVCGTNVNFTLTVSFPGGSNSISFSLPTCGTSPSTVTGSLVAGDTTQPGRLGRNSASTCAGKACPGQFNNDPTARRYHTYNFTNGPTASCLTITTNNFTCSGGPTQIVTAAYLGSYDPNNLCTNYLGDGASTNSFQVNAPANATIVVVVAEATANTAGCSSYSVTVSGLVGNAVGGGSCGAPSVTSVKTHGANGTYSIPMPLIGPSGVEDRLGDGGAAGNHTIVLTYPADPTGTTISAVSSNPPGGTGMVSNVTYSGNDMIVTLSNVSDQQVLSLTTSGGFAGTISAPIGFLAGDVNASRVVTNSDVTTVKLQVGSPASPGTFRTDIDASGVTTNNDVNLVKMRVGDRLP